MTVGGANNFLGFDNENGEGSMSDRTFTYKGTEYTIDLLNISTTHDFVFLLSSPAISAADMNELQLTFSTKAYLASWVKPSGDTLWQAGDGLTLTLNASVPVKIEVGDKGGNPGDSVQGLTATPVNAGMVLNWTGPDGGGIITKWQHRTKTGSTWGSWTDVDGGGAARRVKVTGLNNGTQYGFQVRFAIGSTTSTASSEVTATPTNYLLDTTMTVGEALGYVGYDSEATQGSMADRTFTYKGVNYTINRLDWYAAYNEIYMKISPEISLADLNELKLTWKDETYAGGWSVNSVTGTGPLFAHNAGDISISNGDTGVVVRIEVGTAGGAAFGLQAEPGDQQVRLGWQMPDDGQGPIGQGSGGPGSGVPGAPPVGVIAPIITYEVAWTPEGSEWSEGGVETVDTMEATVTGLENGQSYAFRVRALEAGEAGAWSETIHATPADASGAPTAVEVEAGDGALSVSWTAPTEDGGAKITGYELDAVVKGEAWNEDPLLTDLTETEAEVTDLTNDTEYAVRVRAVNEAGEGEWSETA